MKIRLAILTAAVLTLSYAAPAAFSQSQTPNGGIDPTQNNPTQSTSPGAPPAGSTGTTFPGSPNDKTSAPQTGSASDASASSPTPSQPPAVTPADPDKVKHDGGRSDVDAIGNRKMGGRGLGNWYSIEGEIRMGKQYAQQVEASSKMVQDPVINEYVNRIGQNLVRNSDAQVPFTIKVIDSDEINAFALPGGFFFVDSGLVLAADEEAELAGVMAHEIAHVAARHATRQMTRSQLANIGTIPLIFVGGGIGYAVRSIASIGLPLSFLTFSRAFESEADYLGLQYMYKTGYDPQAFVAFFEKVQALEKKKPGTLSKAFATHPQTPDRIAKSQEEIQQILPARPQYLVTTSEFDEVKARLAALENRRKLTDQKEAGKPSLRRASSTDKNGSDNKSGGDDHPTLKRRDDNNN